MSSIRAFIQARMSSRRFPGKVLAPFRGQPVIQHIVASVASALPSVPIIVNTSDQSSDDPLVAYLATLGTRVFRGSLENVFDRFRKCILEYPCDWILRISADSPLLHHGVLQMVAGYSGRADCDLVTTILPRSFPKGHNVELIRVGTFMSIGPEELEPQDQEHVTAFYYRNPHRFRIVNLSSNNPQLATLSLVVDTVEDLRRLEHLSEEQIRSFSYRLSPF